MNRISRKLHINLADGTSFAFRTAATTDRAVLAAGHRAVFAADRDDVAGATITRWDPVAGLYTARIWW